MQYKHKVYGEHGVQLRGIYHRNLLPKWLDMGVLCRDFKHPRHISIAHAGSGSSRRGAAVASHLGGGLALP